MARARQGRPSRSCARTCRSRRRASASRAEGQRYKVELIDDLVRDEHVETVSLYTNGPFTDLCRGPHAPTTGHGRGVRAAVGRRRLLARRLEAADADARLRHRVLLQGRRSTSTSSDSSWPARATTAASAASSACSSSRSSRRAARSGCPHGTTLWNTLRDLAARADARARLHGGQDAAALRRRAVADLRPLGQVPREHVRHRGRGAPDGAQADELPRPLRALRDGAALLPRPAGALRASRACCTATSPRARSTASCACATSPRTTRTSSAPRSRSRTRSPAASSSASRSTGCSASRPSSSSRRGPTKRIGDDALWDHAEGALRSALDGLGLAYQRQRGRRRLLRAQDRHAHDRLAGPLLAARHRPARLQPAGALRARPTPAPTTPSTAR